MLIFITIIQHFFKVIWVNKVFFAIKVTEMLLKESHSSNQLATEVIKFYCSNKMKIFIVVLATLMGQVRTFKSNNSALQIFNCAIRS